MGARRLRGGLLAKAAAVAGEGWTSVWDACQLINLMPPDLLPMLQQGCEGEVVCGWFCDGEPSALGCSRCRGFLATLRRTSAQTHTGGSVRRPASPRLAAPRRMWLCWVCSSAK